MSGGKLGRGVGQEGLKEKKQKEKGGEEEGERLFRYDTALFISAIHGFPM